MTTKCLKSSQHHYFNTGVKRKKSQQLPRIKTSIDQTKSGQEENFPILSFPVSCLHDAAICKYGVYACSYLLEMEFKEMCWKPLKPNRTLPIPELLFQCDKFLEQHKLSFLFLPWIFFAKPTYVEFSWEWWLSSLTKPFASRQIFAFEIKALLTLLKTHHFQYTIVVLKYNFCIRW